MTRRTVHTTTDGVTCDGCGDMVEWLQENGETVVSA